MKLNKHIGTYKAIWKPIKGYEGSYEVSNLGQVRSVDRYTKGKNNIVNFFKGKILKLYKEKRGYIMVGLWKNRKLKNCQVHRLVAQVFIDNIDNKSCVDHINTCKTNNRVWNLRWVNHKENNNNPLTLKHHSKVTKGENNPMYGKYGKDHPSSKKIYCVELDKMWGSIIDCARELELNYDGLRTSVSHNRKYKGLTFIKL